MKRICKNLTNSKGLTLVEVLASITILSIIIVSFLAFFIQSARTNQVSENIMDATYVAQSEMEEIYNISKTNEPSHMTASLEDRYTADGSTGDEYKFTKIRDGYNIVVTFERLDTNPELGNVVVRVYENGETNQLKAQMETIYKWEKLEGNPND